MDSKPLHVCFLADTHGLFDDRIYWKEALSLKKWGYEVHYILAGENEDSGTTAEGIHYQIIKRDRFPGNRIVNYIWKRWLPSGLYPRMFIAAKNAGAGIYHLHDLRVNRIGNKLRKLPHRPKVIYDVHEPYPENISDYGPSKGFGKLLSKIHSCYIRWWEKSRVRNYDLFITTEENLQRRFQQYFPGKPVEIIYNYTNLPATSEIPESCEKQYDFIYTGGITRLRGALRILEAAAIVKRSLPDFRLLFVGTWFPKALKNEMEAFIRDHELQTNIELKEWVPFNEIAGYYRKSRIGLGIFLPVETHRIILQIKIFEYMNFGLPVIGSNFGHIHSIITQHRCGLTVDPEKPSAIAEAMMKLLTDVDLRDSHGRNGQQAVDRYFRWELMEKKLTELYNNLIQP